MAEPGPRSRPRAVDLPLAAVDLSAADGTEFDGALLACRRQASGHARPSATSSSSSSSLGARTWPSATLSSSLLGPGARATTAACEHPTSSLGGGHGLSTS